MQNHYTGDVGDFGKYGLLRKLCAGPPRLSLGVVWYLMGDEKKDGGHTQYLKKDIENNENRFKACDTELYDVLQKAVEEGRREVAAVERSGVLGDVAFFSKLVDTGNRDVWLREALNAVAGRNLVFLDPDNGIEVKSARLNSPRGGKYCGCHEVREFLKAGASVVLYQHFSRLASAEEQMKRLCRKITDRLAPPLPPFALRFHRGTDRAFLVLPQQRHDEAIQRGIEQLMKSPWKQHFTGPFRFAGL